MTSTQGYVIINEPGSERLEGEPVQARREKAVEIRAQARTRNRNYPVAPASCKATLRKGKGKGKTGTEPGSSETAAQGLKEPVGG